MLMTVDDMIQSDMHVLSFTMFISMCLFNTMTIIVEQHELWCTVLSLVYLFIKIQYAVFCKSLITFYVTLYTYIYICISLCV